MGDPHSIPHESHAFVDDHDFTVIVYDTKLERVTGADGVEARKYVPTKAHEYAVKRDVLAKLPYFKRIFMPGFRDTGKASHELLEDDPLAWKVWLEILHRKTCNYDVSITTVWKMLVLADKYEISPKTADAKEWFKEWYDNCDGSHRGGFFRREVLYPCHTFDYAQGFLKTTKQLAYASSDHIAESRPSGVHEFHLRLDHRILQQLNAARGRLKTILHKKLYAPIKDLMADDHNDCPYKEKLLWGYFKALTKTGAWPLEDVAAKQSIDSLLSKLRRFTCGDIHPIESSNCRCYTHDFEDVVERAVVATARHFDGLCLDCLNLSKLGTKDKDYWMYLSKHNHGGFSNYDRGCRVSHKEMTWYYSFMGSRKDRDEWMFAKKNEN